MSVKVQNLLLQIMECSSNEIMGLATSLILDVNYRHIYNTYHNNICDYQDLFKECASHRVYIPTSYSPFDGREKFLALLMVHAIYDTDMTNQRKDYWLKKLNDEKEKKLSFLGIKMDKHERSNHDNN